MTGEQSLLAEVLDGNTTRREERLMKPRRLMMQAFGPYADKETIDFTVLKNHQLFLITGPTGSGKTTILDAMTFALYGTASGDLQENRSLRSDYASPK